MRGLNFTLYALLYLYWFTILKELMNRGARFTPFLASYRAVVVNPLDTLRKTISRALSPLQPKGYQCTV